METKCSLLCLCVPTTSPYPMLDESNKIKITDTSRIKLLTVSTPLLYHSSSFENFFSFSGCGRWCFRVGPLAPKYQGAEDMYCGIWGFISFPSSSTAAGAVPAWKTRCLKSDNTKTLSKNTSLTCSHSAGQNFPDFMEEACSLPHSQKPANETYLESVKSNSLSHTHFSIILQSMCKSPIMSTVFNISVQNCGFPLSPSALNDQSMSTSLN